MAASILRISYRSIGAIKKSRWSRFPTRNARRCAGPVGRKRSTMVCRRICSHTAIEPLLDNPLVECIGEIDDCAKREFLGNARALLFPIDWPEPFGLVLIEAMACGTPVIAFRAGSTPEVIDD